MDGVASLRRMVGKLESNSPCESVLGRERSLLGGREIVARHRNRSSGAGQGVPDDGLVLVRGEKPPDGGLMLRSAQPILELSLGSIRVEGEELERERILGDLLSKFGVGAFESVRKVRRSRSLPRVQVRLDLVASAGRLQPCATSLALYHSRNSASSSLTSNSTTCPHGNRPIGRWPITSGSGHASANLRMYSRFVGENLFTPGNSVRRSAESRERTLLPHGAVFCRSMIVAPTTISGDVCTGSFSTVVLLTVACAFEHDRAVPPVHAHRRSSRSLETDCSQTDFVSLWKGLGNAAIRCRSAHRPSRKPLSVRDVRENALDERRRGGWVLHITRRPTLCRVSPEGSGTVAAEIADWIATTSTGIDGRRYFLRERLTAPFSSSEHSLRDKRYASALPIGSGRALERVRPVIAIRRRHALRPISSLSSMLKTYPWRSTDTH